MSFLFEFCRQELSDNDYIKVKDNYSNKYIFSGTVAELLTNLNLHGFCVLQYEAHADYIEILVV